MQLDILQIGDDRLLQESKPVRNFQDKKLQKLIDDMIETCEIGKKHTAGLAAPQVGENLQLTVIRRLDLEEKIAESQGAEGKGRKKIKRAKLTKQQSLDLWEPLINPKIVSEDPEYDSVIWEACLSIGKGKDQVWGPVQRPDKIEIEYQDRAGKKKSIKGNGFFSHLLQHEIDHLHGVLFISRVPNPDKNLWKSADLDEYLDKHGKFPEAI